ncbi:M4 family metallopeptidase [Bizionia sediminis]|uniref:M4 family metallopeptidase n=1 Tax=Bizionia sediminis TaxID=1737064 RepID=A0ABW5KPA9_9FLAO
MLKKNYLLIAYFLCSGLLWAQHATEALNTLQKQTDASITLNTQSGVPEFIKFPANKPLTLPGATLEAKAIAFMETYAAVFANNLSVTDFQIETSKPDSYGLQRVTFQQYHQAVPVFDGQLRFHFNANKQLTAVNGNYITNIKVNATPTISLQEANNIAINLVNKQDINYSGQPVFAFKTDLMVFQKGLVQNNLGASFLVYKVEVRNNADVREYVHINAHTGLLVEQFTGMPHAMDRRVYEGNTSNLVWQEGDALPGNLTIWQRNEVIASGHVYNFFNNVFGFVSYDNNDAQMRTINNNPNINCPNANWNGVTANYCNGTASDDVIAHEWGHAYTEYTSGLIYAWQSGALNESFSDIWGETVDLINAYQDEDESLALRTGCASSDRWRIGEDATAFGGAIRDMWNPQCNGHPGKVSDFNYRCSTSDGGGVHSNSGIPNHAYALLVDGGTYNGQTVNGIGLTKAAHIFWRAQSTYLTATSDFATLADALEASCTDLMGVNLEGLTTEANAVGPSDEVITEADFLELSKTLMAVELRMAPESCNFQPILEAVADPCEAATTNPIYAENWESGLGAWTLQQLPSNPNSWESRDWVVTGNLPDGRAGQAAFGVDPVNGNCSSSMQNGIISLQSPEISIPDSYTTGTIELSFVHYIATEGGWDGGNIKYRLNNTSEWLLLPVTAFTANAYNATINSFREGNDNPMSGQDAFTGADEGSTAGSWGRSIINLSALPNFGAGATIQFRFDMGTDGCNGLIGWYIDDITIYNCLYPLSVSNFDALESGLRVFPNPSQGIFNLKNVGALDLMKADVMDINGRVVLSLNLKNTAQTTAIDLSGMASGMYFLKVQSNLASSVIKLVKE